MQFHRNKFCIERDEKEKKAALAVNDVIAATDKEIDVKVYELYGLTKEERDIVEGI